MANSTAKQANREGQRHSIAGLRAKTTRVTERAESSIQESPVSHQLDSTVLSQKDYWKPPGVQGSSGLHSGTGMADGEGFEWKVVAEAKHPKPTAIASAAMRRFLTVRLLAQLRPETIIRFR